MEEIICLDLQNNTLDYLTQWDVNRVIVLKGFALSPMPRVRFSNKYSKVSLVVKPEVVDGHIQADIPNILLQQPYPVIISVFYEHDDNSLVAKHSFSIPVIPCQIPEDYTMIENVEYVSWVEVRNRAESLILQLEKERDGLFMTVQDLEPDGVDMLWFDTGYSENGGV